MKSFLGKKLLFITAHPDDESFLAAGTILANRKAGGKAFLICATYGEKGMSHLKKPVTARKLKAMRKKELFAVSNFLGVAKTWGLGLPDGNVRAHEKKLLRKGLALAKKIHPDIVVGFGKDGITGHHDHIAVGRAARRIARNMRIPYFAFSHSPRSARNAHRWLVHRRRSDCYHRDIVFQKPTHRIPVDAKLKMQALRLHRSQLENNDPFFSIPPYVKKDFLTAEYFA